MSPNENKKFKLIRDKDGVQTFHDPKTGEEFSTTISKPLPETSHGGRPVGLKCHIQLDQNISKQIADIRAVIGSDVTLKNHEMLTEARANGTITVEGLRSWRAEQMVAELKRLGFYADLIR